MSVEATPEKQAHDERSLWPHGSGARRFLEAIKLNKNTPMKLEGTFWLIDNGSASQIAEAKARELIAAHYSDGQHKDFPQWDQALVSLGTNQFVRFDEARIK